MTSSVVTVIVQHEWRHNAGHQASSSEPDLVLTFGYYGMLILEWAECRSWQIYNPEKLDGPPPALNINRWFLRQIDALQMELRAAVVLDFISATFVYRFTDGCWHGTA